MRWSAISPRMMSNSQRTALASSRRWKVASTTMPRSSSLTRASLPVPGIIHAAVGDQEYLADDLHHEPERRQLLVERQQEEDAPAGLHRHQRSLHLCHRRSALRAGHRGKADKDLRFRRKEVRKPWTYRRSHHSRRSRSGILNTIENKGVKQSGESMCLMADERQQHRQGVRTTAR